MMLCREDEAVGKDRWRFKAFLVVSEILLFCPELGTEDKTAVSECGTTISKAELTLVLIEPTQIDNNGVSLAGSDDSCDVDAGDVFVLLAGIISSSLSLTKLLRRTFSLSSKELAASVHS